MKPNNIVFTKDGYVRLIDFGLTVKLSDKPLKKLPKQNAEYSAPEVFKGHPAGFASDRWSFGVIIALLFQLKHPFAGDTEEDIQKHAESGSPNINDVEPLEAQNLIKKCLIVDPVARIKDISSHDLFKTVKEGFPCRFKPGYYEIPETLTPMENKCVSSNPAIYEELEGDAIFIPTSEYFASNEFTSI